jgi:ABC-type phosphate/phosphonate transport system substrate-binding protein
MRSAVPIANARMYSATPDVKAAWQDLLHWTLSRAGLDWTVIDHDPPAPLGDLWRRGDIGLAMMCGLPYVEVRPRPQLIAAPVPSRPRYGNRPVYFTDLVVKADSPFQRLEDTFGGTAGFTVEGSFSGHVAFRHHLLPYRAARGRPLYRRVVGELVHARGVIDALLDGRIDIGPLDSYYHDLLTRNEPSFAAGVRVVATTKAAPIPPLVATVALDPPIVERLRAALADASRADDLAAQRERLLLARFAQPEPADYATLQSTAREARGFDGW